MTQTSDKPEQQIVIAQPAQASRLARVTGWTDSQISLIQQTVAPGASRVELAWFLYNARRLGLEPTLDQIYFIRYDKNKPGEIVIGINGYRAVAEESDAYAGSDPPVFEYHESTPQPTGAKMRVPSIARVTVWKIVQGMRVPFTAEARWEEFYPGDGIQGEQYRKRPHNQLAVRAESHALRKAFPRQTQRLDVQAEAPAEWQEAARLDEDARADPELSRRNAERYDEVFGAHAALPEQTRPKPKAAEAAAPAEEVTELSYDPPNTAANDEQRRRAELWQENRELVEQASRMGLQGVPTLHNRSEGPVLEAANNELRERIRTRNAELDRQFAL